MKKEAMEKSTKTKNFFKWAFTSVFYYLILVIWFVFFISSKWWKLKVAPLIFLIEGTLWFISLGILLLFFLSIIRFAPSYVKNQTSFPIKGWRWIIYIMGWIWGIGSPVFWLIQFGLYFGSKEAFFSNKFHIFTYYWGCFVIGILIFFFHFFLS